MQTVYLLWLIPTLLGALSVYLTQWREGIIPLKLSVSASVLVLILAALIPEGFSELPLGFSIGIAAALIASMIGDYFLSLGDETFIPGLLGFLGAHGGYLTAFLSLGGLNFPVLLIAALVLLLFLLLILRPRLEGGVMLAAVAAYITLTVLVLSAAFGIEAVSVGAKGLFIAGAVSIAVSDLFIAWNKFIRPIKLDELFILTTYYAAQIAIGVACWLSI